MFVNERFGDTRSLGQLAGGGISEALAGEKRQHGLNNGFASLLGTQSLIKHARKLVFTHLRVKQKFWSWLFGLLPNQKPSRTQGSKGKEEARRTACLNNLRQQHDCWSTSDCGY